MCHDPDVTYLGCLLTCLLANTPAPSEAVAPPPAAALSAPLAAFRPMEVRIRKLFLVRPDLLRYPIPYDTVC